MLYRGSVTAWEVSLNIADKGTIRVTSHCVVLALSRF